MHATDSVQLADRLKPENRGSYAFSVVREVTLGLLSRSTPCHGWNLEMLFGHASESLAALQEGIGAGCLSLAATMDADPVSDPVRVFRDRARRLLAEWGTAAGRR
jgi:hypothetical protein